MNRRGRSSRSKGKGGGGKFSELLGRNLTERVPLLSQSVPLTCRSMSSVSLGNKWLKSSLLRIQVFSLSLKRFLREDRVPELVL